MMSQSDTKARLINSAIKIFSQKGYFNTRISDIVKDAGIAQGTFYLYFKSKEDIFYFIVKEISDRILDKVEKYKKIDLPPKEKIINFGEEVYKEMFKYKEIAQIFFFQLMCIDEKFRNIYINVNQRIKEFYIEILKDTQNKEIIADAVLGFGKRLFEFDFLLEGRSEDEILDKFKKGVYMIIKGD